MTEDLGKIMVIGACGQIGSELTETLRDKYGGERVVAADKCTDPDREIVSGGAYEILDVMNRGDLKALLDKYGVDTVFNLAAILSAKGERDPQLAFNVNMVGTYNVLEVSRELDVDRVVTPSSIAVFGPEVPPKETPDQVYLRPRSMYGVTKVAGELLGYYYWKKYGLDVREIRLPGIISYKTYPGGGTTDYAVAAFYDALKKGHYEFFVEEGTRLPMMYMPDCIKALVSIAEADGGGLTERTNYNVGSMNFSALELAEAIQKFVPEFTYDFSPDYRQELADSWPDSLDDSLAREEWGWQPEYDLRATVGDMLENLARKLDGDVNVDLKDPVHS